MSSRSRRRRSERPDPTAKAERDEGPAAARFPKRVASSFAALGRTAQRYSFLIAFVVLVGGGALYGGLHAAAVRDRAFETAAPATHTPAPPPATAVDDQQPDQTPRQLFVHACGTCHTLRAAGAGAGIGPNLDNVRPRLTAHRVRDQIRSGTLDSAMPPNVLLGNDANRVARYVARVAGRRR